MLNFKYNANTEEFYNLLLKAETTVITFENLLENFQNYKDLGFNYIVHNGNNVNLPLGNNLQDITSCKLFGVFSGYRNRCLFLNSEFYLIKSIVKLDTVFKVVGYKE